MKYNRIKTAFVSKILSFEIMKQLIAICILLSFTCFFSMHMMRMEVHAATLTRKYGDVNYDGVINPTDRVLISQHIKAWGNASVTSENPSWILTGDDFKAADLNRDGRIDSRDHDIISKHIAASRVPEIRSENPNWIMTGTFSVNIPDKGYYVIVSAMNKNKAVDMAGGSPKVGTNVQLYDKNGTTAQLLYLDRSGEYFSLRSVIGKQAIHVRGGSTARGTNVQMNTYSKDNPRAQMWKFESAGNGYYYIRSAIGYYLDVANKKTSNGTNIGVWSSTKADNQKFKLISIGGGKKMYAQSKTAVQKSNSDSSAAIVPLSKGDVVYSYCTYGSWSLVRANGKYGFIRTKNIGSTKPGNAQSKVQQRLDKIMSGKLSFDGKTVMKLGSRFTGYRAGEQCKGYAKNVFYLLFKITPGSTSADPKNYTLKSYKGMKVVASRGSINKDNIKDLFSKARPGDFVQIRRRHKGPHSAIVYSTSSNGVTFIEANLDNRNTVYKKYYTWSNLVEKNAAMTVYTPTDYRLK